jgi:alkylation response protein AidB-like acyl-CoA dehydrogenase
VELSLTGEQARLRDTARRLLARHCPPALLRAHREHRPAIAGLASELDDWTDLADAPLADLCVFLEETGAALAPGPFFATAALYRPLGGTDDGTVAWADPNAVWGPRAPGSCPRVLDADLVHTVAVVLPGPAVAFVPRTALDEVLAPVEPAGGADSTRRVFTLQVPEELARSGAGEAIDPARLAAVAQRAAVALAAELLGTCRWLLAWARRHVGEPGSAQHRLLDLARAVERAGAAVYAAARAHDVGTPDRAAATRTATSAAAHTATFAARRALHLAPTRSDGEEELELYLRRACTSAAWLGATANRHDHRADLLPA